MRVALYYGRKKDNPSSKLFDWLVCWWTNSPYSHCELVIHDICYSSSARDGGVRAKKIDLDSGHWNVFEITGDKQAALSWFKDHDGDKYDVAGLFGFVLPVKTNNRSRWFCSEACAAALQIPFPWHFSPDDLHKHLTQ